ncbi:MAG: NAD-dependent epimerase/dehydratase family protein [Candidatus Uhrbacteria bacterium GW2011_GWC2_53_7]|uniref:NAD-dependent epimerase/dehydratase family protein n=1 Tax=Candidatus Uhrbacteria bacterium GW2011_GWC2_53_7 TaxID=1618986 RepID=A0A0G1Y0S3_9BACT|nr:MAG: NAD-dependent epimerase/dehydratase family protein [Candidatus Uhrbacteria bacterium GW2011_GWC2_53_7]
MAVKYRSKILLASSSVVYGAREDQSANYIPESSKGIVDHLSPRACYDEGRRFSETMFETYRQVHGIDVRIARIFRTYGPRMPLFDGHLIPVTGVRVSEHRSCMWKTWWMGSCG